MTAHLFVLIATHCRGEVHGPAYRSTTRLTNTRFPEAVTAWNTVSKTVLVDWQEVPSETKHLINKANLKSVGTYGMQLWGTISNSNLGIL